MIKDNYDFSRQMTQPDVGPLSEHHSGTQGLMQIRAWKQTASPNSFEPTMGKDDRLVITGLCNARSKLKIFLFERTTLANGLTIARSDGF